MIEIIYKGENETNSNEVSIKLPKNVRQIGNCEHSRVKVYVEDFVMTYVKHFGSRNLKYGVLLGNVRHGNGNAYLFVTGAICARPLLDNEIVFDEDVWTGLYEVIKNTDKENIIGKKRKLPAFAYSASSFMLLAVLLGTVALMNASGQLNELKSVVAGIGGNNETQIQNNETAKIIDVAGDVETTTEPTTIEESTKAPEPTVAPVIKEPNYYIVKSGDSLYSISLKMYGNIDMIDGIKQANSISDGDFIKEGDRILLP